MKTLRYFAVILFLLVLFTAHDAGLVSGQTPLTPAQIAKNTNNSNKSAEPTAEESGTTINGPTFVTSLSRVGVQTTQTLPLTLNEAIRRALENNNDIEIAKNDVKIAELSLKSLLGVYDGVFTISPNYDRNSTTGNSATTDFRVTSDFTKQIRPGGGNLRAFFNNNRTENRFAQQQVSNGSGVSSGGAIYSSSVGVTYTQPLWRNFGIDSTRRQIKIQRKRVSQSDADFRRQAITTISQVQAAYWDLVFALRDQQNRVANLNLSKENLRQVEARIAAGAAAPLQKAEVETELANRESDLLLAIQQVSTTENRLKQLLLKDANAAEWSQQVVPTDKPVFSMSAVELDDALKDAMEFRPELSRLKTEKEINKIDIDYFRNQLRPRIDLTSTFSLDGLSSGNVSTASSLVPLITQQTAPFTNATSFLYNLICTSPTPPAGCLPIPTLTVPGSPSYLRGGFSRSIGNFFRTDAPNFTLGVTISFPFKNQTAKADLASARIQTQQIDARLRSQEQSVLTEVRNAVQALDTSRQRVLAARRARESAEIQLEGERKLLEVGRSTTFLLFQRENALTNARNSEIRAETDYNKAVAELQRVTSTTFRANNVEVESPMTQDK
ncbi:MAG: TolC family protein [Acidobacteria bacterium]|nr:TolC family protein [Acidobacteriota bacterium]MBK8811367.1 TolC family protein [Acidobacteriota bacterium]